MDKIKSLLLSRLSSLFLSSLVSLLSLLTITSCQIEPPLHLPDDGRDIESRLPEVILDLDVLWDYKLIVDSITGEVIDSTYSWRDEFYYGWDDEDNRMFGTWNITDPNVFNIRRYFTDDIPEAPHTVVNEHQIEGNTLSARYKFGYYDILAWNEVTTLDGVQSLHFDETTSLDYVTAYTNQSMVQARHSPKHQYAYYQPEFLFAGYAENFFISKDTADYDYYDSVRNVYVKRLSMTLDPRTYIYLTQVILRHNRGRISGIDGTAVLQGMASKTNLNTGITNDDEIAVSYSQRMKTGKQWNNETVDIIGGRLFTFGLCNLNPSRASRATARDSDIRNYLDLNVTFNNGIDSTFVFDVTDQVQKRYKGGIITIVLDVDTINIPSRTGGSGFDAIVQDYDSVTYEFGMAKQGAAIQDATSSKALKPKKLKMLKSP